jgi:TolB protein
MSLRRPGNRCISAALFGLLCLVAWAMVASDPGVAAFPGRPGKIVFSRSGTGPAPGMGDLWIQERSGKQRRLTNTPEVGESEASFSPDGRLIAYVRREQGNADVWVMNSDGSDKRPIVEGELDELQPSFFPGSRSVVYVLFEGRYWTALSLRIDGTQLRRQASRATYPVVSPDGRWLAYSEVGNRGGIHLLNLRTQETKSLTSGSAHELDFSPDGRRIAFTGQRRCGGGGKLRFALLTVSIRDGRTRTVRGSCRRDFIAPAWSPRGDKIVFATKEQEGRKLRFQLSATRPDGAPAGGAPRHQRGTNELAPSWQPLG